MDGDIRDDPAGSAFTRSREQIIQRLRQLSPVSPNSGQAGAANVKLNCGKLLLNGCQAVGDQGGEVQQLRAWRGRNNQVMYHVKPVFALLGPGLQLCQRTALNFTRFWQPSLEDCHGGIELLKEISYLMPDSPCQGSGVG